MPDFRLYVILDEEISRACGNIVENAQQIISGGADILQLRAKSLRDSQVIKLGQTIKNLVQKSRTQFVLNDRADLAKSLDADGVHLGQSDMPLKDARRLLGKDKIIGLSTHSVKEAGDAQRQGADYIGIGPIFGTSTKPDLSPIGPEIIPEIKDKLRIPFVALGGINLDNLDQVLRQGAQRVAVCRAIIEAGDVLKTTQEFRRRLYP